MKVKSKVTALLSLVVLGGFFQEPIFAAPSREEQLQTIQTYLNGIRTLRANFTQNNPNKTISTGKMSLERLGAEKFGKMRLEYAPPAKMRIIANGKTLCHEDGDEVSGYDIDSTPASFLLRPKIDFNDDLEVKDLVTKAGKIYLTLSRSGDDGITLTLVFVTSPFLRLQEWTVTEGHENDTHVTLKDVEIGIKLDPSLFVFSKRCQAMVQSQN